jgi:hypothetical protein
MSSQPVGSLAVPARSPKVPNKNSSARYRPIHLLLLAVIASANPIHAQPVGAITSQSAAFVIPKTPAGEALRAWLDAFNSADSARIGDYARRFQPDITLDDELGFRDQTGGFDLLSIERNEPRHLEFTVRERNSPVTGYGVIEVSATEPLRVTKRDMRAMGPNGSPAALRLDAAGRARVVAGAAALLDTFYVFPDVAKRMGDSLRARLARKAYDQYNNGIMFALRLNDDLAEISHDKHLNVDYSAGRCRRSSRVRPERRSSRLRRKMSRAGRSSSIESTAVSSGPSSSLEMSGISSSPDSPASTCAVPPHRRQ